MTVKFVGKDFLNMPAPPNYKAGIARGDFGFHTTAEKAATNNDQDPEELELLNLIDRKRKKKPVNTKPVANNVQFSTNDLASIDASEWAQIPEATDQTFRHKRMKMDINESKRSYNAPLVNKDQINAEQLRPKLKQMITNQPFNAKGYLQLAELEFKMGNITEAKLIAGNGIKSVPGSVELWTAYINFHSKPSDKRSIARKAVSKISDNTDLWLLGISLEPTIAFQANLAQEALTHLPHSQELWQRVLDLENDLVLKHEIINSAKEFGVQLTSLEGVSSTQSTQQSTQTSENGPKEPKEPIDPQETKLINEPTEPTDTTSDLPAHITEILANFNRTKDLKYLAKAIKSQPLADRPALYLAQFNETSPNVKKRGVLARATTELPHCQELWQAWIDFEKSIGNDTKHLESNLK